ncbi:MAG: DUF4403 family protein [Chlorobi bacterium]|nr:DUF4403 family protein [Chlorobiota bacterium]
MKKALVTAGILLAAAVCALLLIRRISQSDHDRAPDPIEDTTAVRIPPSTFNLPVHFETRTLSEYLNGKIRGTFLQKNLLSGNGGKEKIALALTRNGDISIGSNGKELICTFPLKVDAELLDSRFGRTISRQVKPVHSTFIVTLSTPASIDRNWNIVTGFRIRKIRWISDPVTRIGPFRKNLRPLVEKVSPVLPVSMLK